MITKAEIENAKALLITTPDTLIRDVSPNEELVDRLDRMCDAILVNCQANDRAFCATCKLAMLAEIEVAL